VTERTFTVAALNAAGAVIVSSLHRTPQDAFAAFRELGQSFGGTDPLRTPGVARNALAAWLHGNQRLEVIAPDYQHMLRITINE
jgi:hypothetical protein